MHAPNLDAKGPNAQEEREERAIVTAANLPAAHHKPLPRDHRRRATRRGDEERRKKQEGEELERTETNPGFNLRKRKEEEEKRNLPRCGSVRRREPVCCAATALVSGDVSVCGGGENGAAGTGERGERGGKEEEKRVRGGGKDLDRKSVV